MRDHAKKNTIVNPTCEPFETMDPNTKFTKSTLTSSISPGPFNRNHVMQLQESELLATIGHAKILYTQPLPAYAQFYCKGRNANVQGIAANLLRIHSCTQKDHGVQSRACNKHKEPLFLYTRRSARGNTFVGFAFRIF